MNTNKIQNVQPVQKQDRIQFLDVLRGIAIFFIFSANIVVFSGLLFFSDDAKYPEAILSSDVYLDFIMFTLVDGKFYSIFSLLFGIGCVIQFNNVQSKNKPFAPFFRRRMFWLLIIGLIHLCLFWLGDILTLYALLGFTLIYFIKVSNKKLLIYATILILFPIVNWLFVHFTDLNYAQIFFNTSVAYYEFFGLPLAEWNGSHFPDFQKLELNERLIDFFKMNIGNTFVRIGAILEEGRIFKVLGIFLIGLWAGRKILNENLLNNLTLLKKIAFWGILIGLPISIIRTYIEFFGGSEAYWDLFKTITYALGTVPLAMGLASLLALLYFKKPSYFSVFAPVGKLALSNYLFQTFIAVILFYGIGFGFAGKFGFTVVMLMSICIFTVQVIMSKLWLKHFRFGPFEWIWRQLTYKKRLKLLQDKI
ncbi:DUF418 domain-containing protein [Psychroserpens mesophilus]|uniref:DUF418 domain-containing protein n=1 Tax=Psychroserpens mesophilus TaxID=325473 RepID=UPI00058C2DB1|nr:DUF418 domain-containing protein [Psychroserpens mesophilus]